MDIRLFEKLQEDGHLSEESVAQVRARIESRPFSLHWELKTMLYLGITLFTTGVGMFIYENINTIGHLTIIILLGIAAIAGFIYAYKKHGGYSTQKVESSGIAYDYVVLLSAMLMVSCIGYLQFQYHFFGSGWNLASIIPALLLLVCAYYYDHLGVLSMAITNMAACIGIVLSPMHFFDLNNLNNDMTIVAMFLFGLVLMSISYLSVMRDVKAHFAFTYKNFGFHLLFISLISAMVKFEEIYLLLFLVFAVAAYLQYKLAIQERSSYFFVFMTIYGYIAMSYTFLKLLFSIVGNDGNIGMAYFASLFEMATAVLAIVTIINTLKKLRHEDSL